MACYAILLVLALAFLSNAEPMSRVVDLTIE